MRVVAKFDLFFIVLYALLIPAVGVLVLWITGRAVILPLLLLLEVLYLLLALKKPWQRRLGLRTSLPDEWRKYLLSRSAYFCGLDQDGRTRFERDVRLFLVDVRIRGIGGRPLSWPIRLLIAAGAAAMLHGRPDWEPPLADGVTVYPGMSFDRNYQVKKGNIAGQAPVGGPMLLAEGSLMQGFADGRRRLQCPDSRIGPFF